MTTTGFRGPQPTMSDLFCSRPHHTQLAYADEAGGILVCPDCANVYNEFGPAPQGLREMVRLHGYDGLAAGRNARNGRPGALTQPRVLRGDGWVEVDGKRYYDGPAAAQAPAAVLAAQSAAPEPFYEEYNPAPADDFIVPMRGLRPLEEEGSGDPGNPENDLAIREMRRGATAAVPSTAATGEARAQRPVALFTRACPTCSEEFTAKNAGGLGSMINRHIRQTHGGGSATE